MKSLLAVSANKDTFKYLGMHFTKTANLHEAAARASQPFLAAAYRVCEFVAQILCVLML